MKKSQQGQTLIETLAAAFILIMGVSAAAGLAVFALGSSTSVVKQIIATGLAREGLEAVRNARDTNWLQDTLVHDGCYDFETMTNDKADCYQNWLDETFCLNPTDKEDNSCDNPPNNIDDDNGYYSVGFDSTTPNVWQINKATDYGLDFNDPASGNAWQTKGFYTPEAIGVTCLAGNSGYCRQIIITNNNNPSPYDKDQNLTLLEVQSLVWWTDKKCPQVATFNAASPSCRVELDTYLTNWKNYKL